MAQGKQNVSGVCTGVSIESHAITLTKAAHTTLSFTWQRPNVDIREVQVPVYIMGASPSCFKIQLFGPLA